MTQLDDIDIAAVCEGVRVPNSPFLNDMRIKRLNAARYEGDEIRGALAVVNSSDRVLELGAGLGIVGAVVALNCKPVELRSFEANPNMIPVINELYATNDLTDRISVTNRVLWAGPDRPEKVTFYLGASFLGSSLSEEGSRKREEINVETQDFSSVSKDFSPTVLICDIEGGELELLRHAPLDGLRAIVMEFHPGVYDRTGMQECKQILRDAGFERQDDLSTRTVWTCLRPS